MKMHFITLHVAISKFNLHQMRKFRQIVVERKLEKWAKNRIF